jgi:predicted solute-binding protein
MWMIRDNASKLVREIDFAAERDEGVEHIEEIVSSYERSIGLSRSEMFDYLTKNISFRINEDMEKGLQLFFKLAEKNELIEKRRPMKFI